MLLWVMGVGLENTCLVSGKWIMFPGLFQDFVDGYIKPEGSCKLADEHRVAVMTVGSQS